MRQSQLFGRTLREAPADAQTISHQLMLRAAIARPLAAGIYTWLPLGFRVVTKVEQLIREEMDRIGAQEMELPVLTPAEYWRETGRWDTLEPVTFRVKDHGGHEFMVSYTHEELVTHHARNEILSYRQLPVSVYHFQTKGRDETRPRGGLLRVREFVMKDSYSIDADAAGLDRSYQAHHDAYLRIFRRAGVRAHAVESDTGAMGGDIAHEFQVLSEEGEDTLLFCPSCDYKANRERACRRIEETQPAHDAPPARKIDTPATTTIEALSAFLAEPASAFLKTVLLHDDRGPVAVVLPGDREVNEAKVRRLLDIPAIRFANDADFAVAGGVAGFVGPVGLSARVVIDRGVEARPYITGANEKDRHLRDVVPGRDFDGERADLHDVREGDACPRCGAALERRRGIEVGNIFKFGPYYSDKMGAYYLAEDGTRKPFMLASYGIGLGRLVQTIITEHHDERGILWPMQAAPYHVHLLTLPQSDAGVREAAQKLEAELAAAGVEVLFDDRDETAGVKFTDADLIGLPIRLTLSRRTLKEGSAEVKLRDADQPRLVPLDGVVREVRGIVDERLRQANA